MRAPSKADRRAFEAAPKEARTTEETSRPPPRATLAADPERRALVEARFGRVTFEAVAGAAEAHFGERRLAKSAIHAWWKKTTPAPSDRRPGGRPRKNPRTSDQGRYLKGHGAAFQRSEHARGRAAAPPSRPCRAPDDPPDDASASIEAPRFAIVLDRLAGGAACRRERRTEALRTGLDETRRDRCSTPLATVAAGRGHARRRRAGGVAKQRSRRPGPTGGGLRARLGPRNAGERDRKSPATAPFSPVRPPRSIGPRISSGAAAPSAPPGAVSRSWGHGASRRRGRHVPLHPTAGSKEDAERASSLFRDIPRPRGCRDPRLCRAHRDPPGRLRRRRATARLRPRHDDLRCWASCLCFRTKTRPTAQWRAVQVPGADGAARAHPPQSREAPWSETSSAAGGLLSIF